MGTKRFMNGDVPAVAHITWEPAERIERCTHCDIPVSKCTGDCYRRERAADDNPRKRTYDRNRARQYELNGRMYTARELAIIAGVKTDTMIHKIKKMGAAAYMHLKTEGTA